MTPWTAGHQAPLSMGFPRQDYWSGLSFPSPGHLPESGLKLESPAFLVDSVLLSLHGCRRRGFNPLVGKIPWRKKWQPTPISLHGKYHGQRSLMGYSLWGHKTVGHSLATEQQNLYLNTSLVYIFAIIKYACNNVFVHIFLCFSQLPSLKLLTHFLSFSHLSSLFPAPSSTQMNVDKTVCLFLHLSLCLSNDVWLVVVQLLGRA